MSNVSGLFKDLTTVKKARNGRLASWDQRGKNQDYWKSRQVRQSLLEKWKDRDVSHISG